MATSPTSVEVIDGPLPNAAELDARVEALRQRFPRAIIDRYLQHLPTFGKDVLLAPGAAVAGDVQLGDDVSIWYAAVLRGDLAPVVIGAGTNVQDGAVLHVGDSSPCVVGRDTVVGHRAILHGCRVGDACLIGMQATVLDDATIGDGSIVGAGALVTQRTVIPPRSLVLGAPARVIRTLTADDEQHHRELAAKYVRLKENYRRDALR
ncbi:MAG TPA: gamma carbonic anhydrase family protein [Polyangia bacterium]|jgi:carbonic anhydrase/acetyltransferase-like protein (isoleucine patch superfamily)